ncbi:hypothetical protein Trydic_g288 [Trypoxylus dichotomus]
MAVQPEFMEPITNVTISVARDAVFRCYIKHIGGYRIGYLKVVVPPDFIDEETSSDVDVSEGNTVRLVCKATGKPDPNIYWRREDGEPLFVKEASGQKNKVTSFRGDALRLSKITRFEMGAYLCIASNGIPPAISKRIVVNVHFRPIVKTPSQLVGAPEGTDVTLDCYVEASPNAFVYWIKQNEDRRLPRTVSSEMIVTSAKYEVTTVHLSPFETKVTLVVRNLDEEDFCSYRCFAKNSLGEIESNVRIYRIPGPSEIFKAINGDDIGSADKDKDDARNRVLNRGSDLDNIPNLLDY